MTQKELRKKYMQIIKTEAYPHDAKMQKYCKERCGYIVELTDGKFIRLYKPRKHVPYDFAEIIDKIRVQDICAVFRIIRRLRSGARSYIFWCRVKVDERRGG